MRVRLLTQDLRRGPLGGSPHKAQAATDCRLQQPHRSSFHVQGPCKPGPTGATSRCMNKILAVIFPAKETAIKFTAGSQRRNSCKQVTFALSFGERTMSREQGETRVHLTAPRMGFNSCTASHLLRSHTAVKASGCNLGFSHRTDPREAACFRPAVTPPAFWPWYTMTEVGAAHVTRMALTAFCLFGWKLISRVNTTLTLPTPTHRTHTEGPPPLPVSSAADARAGLRAAAVPAPKPLGTYKQEGFALGLDSCSC